MRSIFASVPNANDEKLARCKFLIFHKTSIFQELFLHLHFSKKRCTYKTADQRALINIIFCKRALKRGNSAQKSRGIFFGYEIRCRFRSPKIGEGQYY